MTAQVSTVPRPWFPYYPADAELYGRGWGWWYFTSPPGYNIGGHFNATPTAAEFLGPDWRERIRRLGGDPDAEYMTAFMQINAPGADKYDYEHVLYMRDGKYYKPIAAYYVKRESGWVSVRDAVVPWALMVISIAGGQAWLAQNIGAAVVSAEFAAAYPAATQAIGQIAVSTAASGGDVEAAVTQVAASYIGAGVGGTVGATFDSQAIGKAAAAATTAALRDGDVKEAVALSFLQSGAKTVDEYFTQDVDYAFTGEIDPGFDSPVIDSGLFPGDPLQEVSNMDYLYGGDVATGFADPQPGGLLDFGSELSSDPVSDYLYGGDVYTGFTQDMSAQDTVFGTFDPSGMEAGLPVTLPPSSPMTQQNGGIFGSGISVTDITNLALAAIKVNAAYQASQGPQPRTVTVSPTGATSTPNANGTVTVRNPVTGALLSVQRPAAGVPYVLADGRTIINNGDGTFSTVHPDGRTVRAAYTTAAPTQAGESGGIPPALLWGGLGLGALLLLKG